jgi:SagB-type dehydrogenase family enzyme
MSSSGSREVVDRYHDGTKHHFNAFARSIGYLDWASQPRLFRAFGGSPEFALYPVPSACASGYSHAPATYGQLYDPGGVAAPLTAPALGDMLRHALGLSAWKQFGRSRWSLRVNPSSGNLHPTEAYVICQAMPGLADTPAVYHYAADRHALEQRCAFRADAWASEFGGPIDVLLIALTSIHWREAWKYGERAFRYCQHDLGHAIAAIGFSAALAGWRAVVLPTWSHASIATLTGIDREEDFIEAEREEPGCIIAIAPPAAHPVASRGSRLLDGVRNGQWWGHASQLSEDHVQWTFIDEVARATSDDGRDYPAGREAASEVDAAHRERQPGSPTRVSHVAVATARAPARAGCGARRRRTAGVELDPRAIVLQRRSALAFDGVSTLERGPFFEMLSRLMPGPSLPSGLLWWTPRVHLALFVHRVNGVAPGVYVLARDSRALERLRRACGRAFLWEPAHDVLPFMCLARGDARALAARLSCDQDIAGDGFFSLGMIAEFSASLDEYGASFYRNLFWETGVVGQALYLEAEAAGVRATGIGCFYDDPVHDALGLQGHAFQSLYHFTVGMAIEDRRLTTEPGYEWELARSPKPEA